MKKTLFAFVMMAVGVLYAADPLGVGFDAAASAVEKKSAKELVSYLSKITGKKFKIVPAQNARFRVGHKFVNDPSLGNEGFKIVTANGVTSIGGGNAQSRGTLYGVYEYLEKCGVRFWTKKEEFLPKIAADKLPVVNDRQMPSFPYGRMVVSSYVLYGNPKFKANMTCSGWWTNGMGSNYRPEDGVLYDLQPWNGHSMMFFIPPEKYGKDHPEWFALVNGKRTLSRRPVPGQLCLSNKEMQKEFFKNVKEYLKKRGKPGTILAVTQEDNYLTCTCPDCQKADNEELIKFEKVEGSGFKIGNHTGSYVRFMNKLAESLEKDYPDLKIIGSAYLTTALPPKNVKMHKNIMISLAFLCDLGDATNTHPDNRMYFKLMNVWKDKVPGGLRVCDYGSTFDNYFYPMPNFDAIANRLRLFKKNGVISIGTIDAHTGNGGGEFSHLRNYLTYKLYWNCNLDPWQIAKEFCVGYYGKGGIHLYDYIKWYHYYLHDVKKGDFSTGRNPVRFYDKAYVDKAKSYFKKAYAESGNDPVFKKRIDRAYVAIRCIDMIQRKNSGDTSAERMAEVKKFEAECKRFDITAISEAVKMKDFIANLALQVPTPEFCKGEYKDKWFAYLPSCYPYWGWGNLVDDKDPASFSKRPFMMNTNHLAWAVYKKSQDLPGAALASGIYDAYVYVKVIHQPGVKPTDSAFQCGWSDSPKYQSRKVPVKEVPDGKYVYVKIATDAQVSLHGTIWCAPLKNQSKIKNFYVDHFVFVRKD